MEKPSDCFLVVRFDDTQMAEIVSPLCVECGNGVDGAMFWSGARGYSPYLWECCECGVLIYDPGKDEHA